jgi:hypothetical protein
MNSGSLIEQCILVHDANNRTLLSLDYSTNSANVNVSALMVVNPSDVNSSSSFEDDSDVCTATPPLAPLSMSDKDWPEEA